MHYSCRFKPFTTFMTSVMHLPDACNLLHIREAVGSSPVVSLCTRAVAHSCRYLATHMVGIGSMGSAPLGRKAQDEASAVNRRVKGSPPAPGCRSGTECRERPRVFATPLWLKCHLRSLVRGLRIPQTPLAYTIAALGRHCEQQHPCQQRNGGMLSVHSRHGTSVRQGDFVRNQHCPMCHSVISATVAPKLSRNKTHPMSDAVRSSSSAPRAPRVSEDATL